MKVDHIGYAVSDMTKAREAFEALGYHFEETFEDETRKVDICFGRNGTARVELISPAAQGSPVDELLKKNRGGVPYHICYQVSDIGQAVQELRAARYKVVVPPAPACAFKGRQVAFLYHLTVGLIELVEMEVRIK